MDFQATVDNFFGILVKYIAAVLFYEMPLIKLPFILSVMVAGGLFFTLRYGFINVRLFKHALDIIRGKYDDPSHPGEISHFQALASALSATVGLGNIAGVAVAIQLGGPGAVFWLWVVAFFGMSMKFTSCTYAQVHRIVCDQGKVLGGPMVYLTQAFKEQLNMPRMGLFLRTFSAVATVLGSLGGGNLFQANQTYELVANQFPYFADKPLVVGIVLAFLAGLVILGGIQRIAKVTSKLVPAMVFFYAGCCMAIILTNLSLIPSVFAEIFTQAFVSDSIYAGGFVGVLIQGVKRGSFSNEAGVGSAAIAHAAAKTDMPIREGLVAMLGPFIDTIIICTMTALAILITDAHLIPELAGKGAQITAAAFATIDEAMPILLTIAVAIFAYSTVISYSYYGERAIEFLFSRSKVKYYRLVFIFCIIFGPVISLKNVIDFSDLMLLSMALPNIIGLMFLSKKIKDMAQSYILDYKEGKFKTYKE
jgi:AGCS family alanine or glycine:cation symporter